MGTDPKGAALNHLVPKGLEGGWLGKGAALNHLVPKGGRWMARQGRRPEPLGSPGREVDGPAGA